MNGRLSVYLRRRVGMQILALLAVLTAMMHKPAKHLMR